jgi:hypothetical protein
MFKTIKNIVWLSPGHNGQGASMLEQGASIPGHGASVLAAAQQ